MEPFYIMVFAAGLAVAGLFFHVLGLFSRLLRPRRTFAYERRDGFLDFQERLCLGTVEEAVGRDFRVFARVGAGAVLVGDRDLGRRRRRAATRALGGRMFDFLVCSAADAYPLCAVLASPPEPSRARRRELTVLRAACSDAGLPWVELTLADGYELTAMRRELLDAIESAEVRIAPTPDPVVGPDEESLLAELAAAMQEPGGRDNGGRSGR
ncbi:MAG: DUF2726 domain-containing protein [Gammaproteobacteria bacterium]|nr:DUF2726 domain-containing protein [Gammaproteobacteria bacterium]